MYTLDQIRAVKYGDMLTIRKYRRVVWLGRDESKFVLRRYKVIGHPGTQLTLLAGRQMWTTTPEFLYGTTGMVVKITPAEQVQTRKQPEYSFAASDGGRVEAGIQDKRDCSVRAVALALDVPYQTAHDYLAGHGRKSGHGVHVDSCYRNLQLDGKSLWRLDLYPTQKRQTVNRWLTSKCGVLPSRCILEIRGHVFAVVSGKVLDTFKPGPRSKVLSIWQVEVSK